MNIPLAVPNLSGREAEYLMECVSTTFVSTAGPFVPRFEAAIAQRSGTSSAVVTCAGTVALHVALEALGVGAGDLVMVPSLTFIATANSIVHSGAAPWLVDVRADDWMIDLDLASAAIERETDPHPRGRRHRASGQILSAVMPVMIMGASFDFPAMVEFARRYGLRVVVDAAAAIGATANGVPLGQTGVDAVCFSFNGNKTITSGGGGAVAAADSSVVKRISHLISTGRPGASYDHDIVAYNFRMTNLQAAVGLAQIEQLDGFLARKQQVAETYASLADSFEALDRFASVAERGSVHWFSGVFYTGDDPTAPTRFVKFMKDQGIDVRPFWKPMHLQPPYRDAVRTTMAVCESVWERVVPLPCSTGITHDELRRVVGAATEFWSAAANGST